MEIFDIFWELAETGGPIMIPIGLISLWMWTLIVMKAEWIFRVKRRPLLVSDALKCLEEEGDFKREAYCPRAAALTFFLQHYFRGKAFLCGEADQLFFEVAIRRQTQGLYRHIPAIMILAAAAPLLGLLGTVSGMVETFRVIGSHGMGNAQAMASGIKESMITTQAGLLVAIPGILAGQAMRKEIRNIHQSVLVFHKAVSQWLEKEWLKCAV
ncbi:MAG: MotA/TolQ/ExbB proton channel family protein [Deltaproteobacteria bacterium]|nr:MotA/TolQ/ExbB proton channel family protein [Deltaproteobacteria bacterium]